MKAKHLVVMYKGEVIRGSEKYPEHNSWIYINAIDAIGAERIIDLGLTYKKGEYVTDIVIEGPKPEGFVDNRIGPKKEYGVILLTGDDARLKYLLDIKARLNLSDEEFTAELV